MFTSNALYVYPIIKKLSCALMKLLMYEDQKFDRLFFACWESSKIMKNCVSFE